MPATRNITEEEWALLQSIGGIFKELRLEHGLTQKAAAQKLGTSQARVPVLEHGQADVMLLTLNRWANLYGHEVQISLVPIEDEFDKALREAMEELEEEQHDNTTRNVA